MIGEKSEAFAIPKLKGIAIKHYKARMHLTRNFLFNPSHPSFGSESWI